MILPNLHLPDYFIHLLKKNMLGSNTAVREIAQYIYQNKAFYLLLEKTFPELDGNTSLEMVINSMGWKNFKAKLSSIFIERALKGTFPHEANIDLAKDILILEDRLRSYTIDGYSRGFLYIFYTKIAFIKLKQKDPSLNLDELMINDSFFEILDISRSRVVEIDWVLFCLSQFKQFLGKGKLIESLKAGKSYGDIYGTLDQGNRTLFVDNALNYAGSINDSDTFFIEMG